MKSVFIQEQKRYAREKLYDMFEFPGVCPESILNKLEKHNVVKRVKKSEGEKDRSELLMEDILNDEVETCNGNCYYVFTFVGVIIVESLVLKCYPKYLPECTKEPEGTELIKLMDHLSLVIKVLYRYKNAKEQSIYTYNDQLESGTYNKLAVMLFLLRDYFEYGVYTNTREIIETNGSGEIQWNKTINETWALISNNRPYYPELLTRKRVNDDFDYFKRLHECILSRCSADLKEAYLLDMFGITEVNLSDETLENFGEIEYIRYRIDKELHVQFNTRKQLLLRTMRAYIDDKKTSAESDNFSMYGTNSFNMVWEEVCKEVLNNRLNTRLGELPVVLKGDYIDKKDKKLIDLIDKPQWNSISADLTLRPDIISIEKDGDEGKLRFVISDAKYYNVQFENSKYPVGLPGIDSITKQYLYELAYREFIDEHGIKCIANCFLLPTAKDEVIEQEAVSLGILNKQGLQDIQVRQLPAEKIFKNYVNNTKMKISELKLDQNEMSSGHQKER